jgi:MFS family permease
MKGLSKRLFSVPNILALGVVSFFNDVSSEMIYPLLPLFITGVLGAGASALGAIEGVAEAVLSLTNVTSGHFSDEAGKKKPFILAGYLVANTARPLMGVTSHWWHILGLRTTDRLGKGIRTPARDGLIALSVPPESRGAAFGFQRGMDNAGAFLGPLLAFLFLLHWHSLRALFLLAAIPGAVTVLVVLFRVREVPSPSPGNSYGSPSRQDHISSGMDRLPFKRDVTLYLAAMALFSLGNSSDAFLMLKAGELGFSIVYIPLLWMTLHASRALFSLPGGMLADAWGRKRVLLMGWGVYGVVYLTLALLTSSTLLWLILLLYGLYYGLAEGAEKALLSSLVSSGALGKGFGWFHGVKGLALLSGNLLFGYLWQAYGAPVAFAEGTLCAILAVPLLMRVEIKKT